MTQHNAVRIFEEKKVRTVWDDEQEKWYFSVVDIVSALTQSNNPQIYWRVLKKRLIEEGNETVTNCNGLKMLAPDGKMRKTDVVDMEQAFRLIQSIPSPKAEPFKLWMAHVAAERINQIQDPELSINQALSDYRRLGYSENWINQRLKSIEIRKDLTDEWKAHNVKVVYNVKYTMIRKNYCNKQILNGGKLDYESVSAFFALTQNGFASND